MSLSILDKLNSGELHAKQRAQRPECVCDRGSIHGSAARAQFLNWLYPMMAEHGDNVRAWPSGPKAEYDARYFPSNHRA